MRSKRGIKCRSICDATRHLTIFLGCAFVAPSLYVEVHRVLRKLNCSFLKAALLVFKGVLELPVEQ